MVGTERVVSAEQRQGTAAAELLSAAEALELLGGTSPGSSMGDTIVAYEADQLDSDGCAGWSVEVVGRARPVTDEAVAGRYRQILPALAGPEHLVTICPDVVSGRRTATAPPPDR